MAFIPINSEGQQTKYICGFVRQFSNIRELL